MAQLIADRRDVDFVLHEQLEVESLAQHKRYEDFTRKTVDIIVSEARNLAIKEILPTLKPGDEEGCIYENGKVRVPESFHKMHKIFCEGGWVAMCDAPDWGGQGMPVAVSLAAQNFFNGANFPFMLHYFLTHGAGKLVETFGTEKQKTLFLEKLYTGEWGGTMLLTEPEAGSDVGALTTSAIKKSDGTYSITGSKIFISSGENDLVENIIHPVLARIEGAPQGTAGISLFLVPKNWVNDDGSLGNFNDVVCTGIEEKMGLHGSPTCSMTLGGKGKCRGMLLGKINKGMSAMFVMMNEARLDVGIQALGCASASFMNALNYARERVQGRALHSGKTDSQPVPIIQHPDVRRMLLTMKVYTEGIRSIIYYIGYCEDVIHTSSNPDEKARRQGIIDVLIPIAKGYASERAFDVCNLGIQIFGGYGFTKEYPQEQLLRDCKITHIYEGTNGIQAMDLLGRKLGLNNGKAFADLLSEMNATIKMAKNYRRIQYFNDHFEGLVNRLMQLPDYIETLAGLEKINHAYAMASRLLEVTGETVLGWMLLWRAAVAAQKLKNGAKKKDISFYEGQLKNAAFFDNLILPVTIAKINTILKSDVTAVDISDNNFGGK